MVHPMTRLGGRGQVARRATATMFASLAAVMVPGTEVFAVTIYVWEGATGANNGASWIDAFSDLQPALWVAQPGDEIWVASGTYRPSVRTTPSDPRSVTFSLVRGVSVYGGFAGTETSRSQRDFRRNTTILSGELGDPGVKTDNAYMVVQAVGCDWSTVVDGLTISGGYDDTLVRAGLRVQSAALSIANCVFQGNSRGLRVDGEARVANCRFLGNGPTNYAAALMAVGKATVVNSVFVGNRATIEGGAMEIGGGESPTSAVVTNCVFMMNDAPHGSAIYVYSSTMQMRNSIVTFDNGVHIDSNGADPVTISYSRITRAAIEGGQLAWGPGNIDADPLFVDADGPDNIFGTIDDDLRLQQYSPCIDAGDNGAVVVGVDLLANQRRVDSPDVADTGSGVAPLVDMGAYEYDSEPLGGRLYVHAGATGTGTGIDWANALTDLPPALLTALVARDRVSQIWVAAGGYRPDLHGGDRGSTFHLFDGVAVFGGFAGTETDLSERDPDVNVTILSGDLNGNDDAANPSTYTDNVYHVVTASHTNATAILDGFTISGGNADGTGSDALGAGVYMSAGKPTLNRIRVSSNQAGGAVYSDFGQPQLGTLTIDTGTSTGTNAGILSRNQVWLQELLSVGGGSLQNPSLLNLQATHFEGPGRLELSRYAELQVTNSPFYDPTILRTDVTGAGVIHIAAGQQLNLEGSARVNLERQAGDQCSDPIGTGGGRIIVDGTLIARDQATIENTNICVNQADVQGTSKIQNNNIRLLETTTGFGGQFYVEDTASIVGNHIVSEGDRYLDLDPNPDPNAAHPDIRDNLIEVIIKPGTPVEQGTLLELRSPDEDCADPDHCASGVFSGGNGYNDKWVLQKLELEPNAKLNLTNRQGFDFNPSSTPDTVYVKQLILNAGSVLNVAGQRLYYQELIGDPSQIVDEPLLGFSLGIIGMNDDTEFDVRLRKRLTDEADRDPLNPNDPLPEGIIERITLAPDDNPPSEGVMRMQTHKPNEAKSASSVAAKGHFARAAEDQIDIVFQYRFCSPDGELIVKISGNREADQGNVEVARIQPIAGTAGSMGNAFAVFQQSVPRGELNFLRGTFIELELRGKDTCVLIDNFDPRIECNTAGKCGDLNNNWGIVNAEDYLLLLASYGSVVRADDPTVAQPTYRFWCLDINGDKYVDGNDLMAWETAWRTRLNLCGTLMAAAARMKSPLRAEAGSSANSILMAGKQKASSQNDYLYRLSGDAVTVNPDGRTAVASGICPVEPVSPAGGMNTRANGRLITGSDGEIYQINGVDGLYRIRQDGSHQRVLQPGAAPGPMNNQLVYIGTNDINNTAVGLPIADAVVRQEGTDTCVYVVPAVVQTTSNGITYRYRAAAKLILNADASFSVANLYGEDPGPPTSTWSPVDHGRPREIELDDTGTTLYVVSAQAFNGNDYVLVYNANDTNPAPQRVISLYGLFGQESDVPRGATAMLLSGNDLYLAAAVNPLAQTHTRIYRFRAGTDCTTGLCPSGRVDIRNPTVQNSYNTNPMIGFVTALAKNQDGNLYVAGVVSPTFTESQTPPGGDLFTTPTVAIVKPEWFDSAPSNLEAAALTCQDLALPAGLAFGAPLPSGPAADFDGDGDVDGEDLATFVSCRSGPMIPLTGDCAKADFDRDGNVDQSDLGLFQRCYGGPGVAVAADCTK